MQDFYTIKRHELHCLNEANALIFPSPPRAFKARNVLISREANFGFVQNKLIALQTNVYNFLWS